MANKQTAVQKIIERVKMYPSKEISHYLLDQIIMEEESLALEKEQIIDAFEEGDCNGTSSEWGYNTIGSEQYYNKTYGKN